MLWKTKTHEFDLHKRALLMGILNVTADSFSDGGRYLDPKHAVAHALEMTAAGADIIDVGGESTRPGAEPVPEDEELRCILPVIERLATDARIVISIDTMKPAVARAALQAGAGILNDVGTSLERREMWALAAESGAAYVCMHMQGTPATMQKNPVYGDVVQEVGRFFEEKLERLRGCGILPEQIILDPGIGFGKTMGHNLELLGNLSSFARFSRPLLLGVSRKSFLGQSVGDGTSDRLAAGLACTCLAVQAGVQLFRTHDVAETIQAVRMAEAILERRK